MTFERWLPRTDDSRRRTFRVDRMKAIETDDPAAEARLRDYPKEMKPAEATLSRSPATRSSLRVNATRCGASWPDFTPASPSTVYYNDIDIHPDQRHIDRRGVVRAVQDAQLSPRRQHRWTGVRARRPPPHMGRQAFVGAVMRGVRRLQNFVVG